MSYDRDSIKKKLMWEVITSWTVLAPFAIGATILLFAWGLSLKGIVAGLIGAAFIAVSFGIFLKQMTSTGVKQKVIDKLKLHAEREERQRLDELDAKLAQDRDPRTQQLLRNMRRLRQTFSSCANERACASVAGSIIAGVEDLFADSVRALETTLTLKATSDGLVGEEAKQPILERRERLIVDVEATVNEMSSIISGLQVISTTGDNDLDATDELRSSLSDKLVAIRRTQEEMAELQVGIT